jgi:hypothetical protein
VKALGKTQYKLFGTFGLAIVVTVVLASCGGEAASLPPAQAWPLTAEEKPCEEGFDCVLEFTVNGVDFASVCRVVRDDHVTNTVLATGALEMRVVRGVDPKLFVAGRAPAAWCEQGAPPSKQVWQMFKATDAPRDSDALRQAICDALVLTTAQREAEGCP